MDKSETVEGLMELVRKYIAEGRKPDYDARVLETLRLAVRDYAERLASTPAPAAPQERPKYEGPKAWTPEEAADGNKGIRWVTETYVAGRPSAHDVREYLQKRGAVHECNCAECAAFYAPPAAAVPPSPASGWIPCDERMPEVGTDCLVWCTALGEGKHFAKVDRWDEQREAPVSWSSATIPIGPGWDDSDYEDISHWMPLPPLPADAARASIPAGPEGGSHV